MNTNIIFGLGHNLGALGNGTAQAGRFGWKMRTTALVVMLTTGGLPFALNAARCQQAAKIVEAMKPRIVNELKAGTTDKLTAAQWAKVDAHRAQEAAVKAAKKPDVRVLSPAEMQKWHGSGPYRNKYFAGTLPWHRSLRDVNLCNGNVFKSFTDVQVAPGRGAGLAMQRTYNSQDERPGPFGIGWTHCYDLRMEEENPSSNENDDALNVSDRTDFFGGKHKYHRDADGLYSPPPYLFDETQSSYDTFLVSGPIVALDDTETGMDGTVKHFVKIADNWRACNYIQDRYGSRTVLTYGAQVDGANVPILLSSVTDPVGRTLAFSWVNLGTTAQPIYRISQVDGPQYSVAYAYNAEANLSSVTLDPGVGHLNRTTTFGYTSVSGDAGTDTGLLSSVSDPLGHTLTYTYAASYTTNGFTTPTPTATAWGSSVTEPAGVDTNNTARTLTWNIVASSGYPTPSSVATSSTGLYYALYFDNQLRASSSGVGNSAGTYRQTYDSANNVLNAQGGWNTGNQGSNVARSDTFTFGPHGNQLTHTVDGFTGTETTTYYNGSQFFQKKSVTDMNGHTTTFGVGSKYAGTPSDPDPNPGDRGSVLWVKDAKYGDGTLNASGTRFSYSYNAYGQKVSETNQNGVVTNYSYGDAYGNLTQIVQDPNPQGQTSHLARTTSMVYDEAGHVLTSTDPMGQQNTFSYNVLGQPASASFPATFNGNVQVTPAETVLYSYGANGRTESVSDNRGTTTLAYEAGSDRVYSATDPVTGTTSYTYGVTGERLSMSLPGSGSWTYGYVNPVPAQPGNIPGMLGKDDPNSLTPRLSNLTDDQGRRIDVSLDILGHTWQSVSNQTFTTGGNPQLLSYQQTQYTMDSDGSGHTRYRLMELANTFASKDQQGQWQSKLLVQNDYAYDTTGQRLSNQISSLDPTTGNPTSRTELYGYDELNRLTSVDYGDGQTQGYTFDSMGNRLTKTDSSTGNESYVVNATNMLTGRTVGGTSSSYTNDANGNTLTGGGRTNTWDSQNRMTRCVNGNNTSTFTYACDGIRHSSVVNNVSTDFVLDASMFVRELHNGLVKATYFMGANGPAYRRDDANGGTVRWYLYDGLGSVLGEVDPSGNITARRKYDVYGMTRSGSDAGTSKHKFVGQLGHPSEDETGLIYMRARYYDPQTGRFADEDPAVEGNNWFAYCNNNPINYVDKTGRLGEILNDTLHIAYDMFNKWSSSGDIKYYLAALSALRSAIKKLRMIANTFILTGEAEEMSAAEEGIASSILNQGGIGAQVTAAQSAIGAGQIGIGNLAKVCIRIIEEMLEVMQPGS